MDPNHPTEGQSNPTPWPIPERGILGAVTSIEETGRPTLEVATLVVRYPSARGQVVLRGDTPPLDWHRDIEPSSVDGDVHTFRIAVPPGRTVEVKPYRTDGKWASGRNLILSANDVLEVAPAFEREQGHLWPWHDLPVSGGSPLRVRVLVPPGYEEHASSLHPVLYALDGQALWSDQQDPFGVWCLDHALHELWALGVIRDLIVVSIDTGASRLDRLGPSPDATYGGGHGDELLRVIVEELVPAVDRELRSIPDRAQRALLGASMGGLFSFHAAWSRPDVFGAAICLSSSFWWADRALVRHVQRSVCPDPRPRLYLDSGATASPFQEDADLRDGQHHTRAMMRALMEHCYVPGQDLHVLAFPGQRHGAEAWGARVAIPLQLLFPVRS
jgi:predicted alpha/beta superfamily hydrolase